MCCYLVVTSPQKTKFSLPIDVDPFGDVGDVTSLIGVC